MTKPSSSSAVEMTAAAAPRYQVRLAHGPSGTTLTTEAPRDNGGTGASFSPTDLVGAALASCALTTMALVAAREGIAFDAARASATVTKEMVGPPRRIGSLALVITLPADVAPADRPRLEEIARTCPVARSLHPDVALPIEVRYEGGAGG